jgi:hypothetical protein
MQTILELVGSTIIGGMLLMLMLTSKANVSKSSNSQVANSRIQSNITTISDIIETDIKKLGYRIPSGTAITRFDSTNFSFKFYNDTLSLTDSIYYSFNTSTNKLFRNSQAMNLGTSNFKFYYFDSTGNKPVTASLIRSFKIAVTVQDTFKYDGNSVIAYWEKTFKPQNL